MESYEFVERNHRVSVTDRLKSYNLKATEL